MRSSQKFDPQLLVLWHSLTGGSRQMADAAAGAARAEITVRQCPAGTAGPEDLLAASGYLFVCPEMLGSMAGDMKAMFERCYYPLLDRIQGRPYAMMICAGSDGQGAAAQIARIVTGWRLKPAAPPVIVCTRAQTPEAILSPKVLTEDQLEPCRSLGAAFAAGLALGIY